MSSSAIARPPDGDGPVSPTEQAEPVSADGRYVSEHTYWREYYFESDIHYEWNNHGAPTPRRRPAPPPSAVPARPKPPWPGSGPGLAIEKATETHL
ncbi:MAG: hypothetical protein LJE69_00730 [Thiohalocapsa sp.]|uniref:hypothetical protein n=1 Tax=Thiohalocapsa sp. TaxID=2497641 RepID=UPI0025F1243C|nr:hypothetical protein [Thiohalocapsa sp.]MCG6939764.1 hypothetical protein [Thiohalocapsa sp.]